VNGPKDSKADMVYDKAQLLMQNMRAHGRTDCKMATVLKPMPMEVNSAVLSFQHDLTSFVFVRNLSRTMAKRNATWLRC
jgi:hypothetical protein